MTQRRTIRQSAEQSLLIDALAGETFIIDFTVSVSTLRIKNVSPGQLYVFVLVQDATGGHRLVWPSTIRNATMLNPASDSVTVQSCIGMTGGYLSAIPPGTWTA